MHELKRNKISLILDYILVFIFHGYLIKVWSISFPSGIIFVLKNGQFFKETGE